MCREHVTLDFHILYSNSLLVSPDDYSIPSPTVTIMPSGMACLTLSIIDDFVFENDEYFEIGINSFSTACGSSDVFVSGSAQTTTVTILDNESK